MDCTCFAARVTPRSARTQIGLTLGIALLAACSDPHSGSASGQEDSWAAASVLLVTLDTTRADALTSFGGLPGITPALDALALVGLSFDRAYTVAPLTLPSHASILTGLIPPRHGLRVNGAARLGSEAETLAELARAAGLTTAAFVSAVVLDQAFGLDQGFELYDAPRHTLLQTGSHFNDRSGADVVKAAALWLAARHAKERFFLWVHLWDAHSPWNPPPELRALAPHDASGYLGDVALQDRAFGRLIQALRASGHYDRTLIVVVADHGEAFLEHGESSHGALLYEPTVHVPLILRFPKGYRAGERSDDVVSVVDLLPTVVDALGLELPTGLDGHSLLRESPTERGAYFESYYGYLAYGWAPLVGYVDGRGKYLDGGKPMLFDPVRDPEEKRDFAGQAGRDVEPYRKSILKFAQRPSIAREVAPSDSTLSAGISALGYAELDQGLSLPAPLEPVDLPDPNTHVSEHAAMLDALGAFNRGDYVDTERRCRAVLARNRGNTHALERLGIALIRQGRYSDGVAPLQRAQSTGRGSAAGAVNLGTCYRKLGQLDLAREAFERALAIDGSQVRAARQLVDLYLMAGEKEQARKVARLVERLTGEALPIR